MRIRENETQEQRDDRLRRQREGAALWRANHPEYKPDRNRRIENQRAYEARRLAKDPEGTRLAQREARARHRAKNPEAVAAATKKYRAKPEARAKFNANRRRYRAENIVRMLVNEARSRARKRDVEFTITVDDVPPMGTHCPLLGLPFDERVLGVRSNNTPSLDRIDPTQGYIPGNVWIVGYRANLIKNDGTADEHAMIAEAMRAR